MPGTMNVRAKLSAAAIMLGSAVVIAGITSLTTMPVKSEPIEHASIEQAAFDRAAKFQDRLASDANVNAIVIRQVSDRITIVIRNADSPAFMPH